MAVGSAGNVVSRQGFGNQPPMGAVSRTARSGPNTLAHPLPNRKNARALILQARPAPARPYRTCPHLRDQS